MRSLLELFDELCDLDAAAREARLALLRTQDSALASQLADMLVADARTKGPLARNITAQSVLKVPDVPDVRPVDRRGSAFGPFRILHELGSGGMGSVWLAERTLGSSVQLVALKFMRRQLDPRLIKHFDSERDALAKLEHPTIARLIDAGVTPEGEPYLATEYVEGTPLLDAVRSKRLGLDARLQLVEALCEAVDYAHRRLLVHRDIKPSNVLVDRHGRPRLLDFGIAKSLDIGLAEQTQDNPFSPAYASPEQLMNEPISTATDIFALGLLLYELLAGSLPVGRRTSSGRVLFREVLKETIEAPSLSDLQAAAERDPVVATRDWPRRLRGDLDQIVLKALRREPDRRYASALALADDLRRFRHGRTISARPDSTAYRVRKLLTRHPWTSAAAALAVCAMTVLTVWALQSSVRAEAAAARALRAQAFLLSIFSSADQTQTQGEKLTAKEILASASARLDAEFKDAPEQQVELKLALAQIYENVLDLKNTEKLASEALQIALSLEGKLPQYEARARRLLASCAYSSGRFEDALHLNGAAVAGYAVLGNAFRVQLGEAQIDQGVLFGVLERADDADRIQIEGLQNIERARGRDSVEYADAQATRGLQLQATARYEEARQHYAAAASTLAARVGEVHPKTTKARLALAGVLDQLDQQEAAEKEFARVIPAMRKLFDHRGSALAGALFTEGNFLNAIGKPDLAEKNFREVIAMVDSSDFMQAHALRYLGQLLTENGRTEEAMAVLARSVEGYRQTFGEANAQIWRAEADLGDAMFQHGLKEPALRKQMLAVEKLSAIAGQEGVELIRPLRGLAISRLDLGQVEQAAAHYAQALSIARAKLGDWHTISCKLRAGAAEVLKRGVDQARQSELLDQLRSCRDQLAARKYPDPTLPDVDNAIATLESALAPQP